MHQDQTCFQNVTQNQYKKFKLLYKLKISNMTIIFSNYNFHYHVLRNQYNNMKFNGKNIQEQLTK